MNLPNAPLSIRPLWLCAIYLPLLLALLIVPLDIFWLGQSIQSWLPNTPYQLLLFPIFFDFPHIVSSLISFADRDYLRFYRWYLGVFITGALILTVLFAYFSAEIWLLAIWAFLTMFHVVRQQFGIGRAVMKNTNHRYEISSWLAVGVAFLLYLLIVASERSNNVLPIEHIMLLIWGLWGAFLVFSIWNIPVASSNPCGRLYYFLNCLLVLTAPVFFVTGYAFFYLLVPRVIHDLTANTFYAVHDHNRRLDSPRKNWIMGNPLANFVPAWILSPALGVVLVFIVPPAWALVFIFLSFLHYGLESVMWRTGSLHRKQLKWQKA